MMAAVGLVGLESTNSNRPGWIYIRRKVFQGQGKLKIAGSELAAAAHSGTVRFVLTWPRSDDREDEHQKSIGQAMMIPGLWGAYCERRRSWWNSQLLCKKQMFRLLPVQYNSQGQKRTLSRRLWAHNFHAHPSPRRSPLLSWLVQGNVRYQQLYRTGAAVAQESGLGHRAQTLADGHARRVCVSSPSRQISAQSGQMSCCYPNPLSASARRV